MSRPEEQLSTMMEHRVTKLETQMSEVRSDLSYMKKDMSEIKTALSQAVTKTDLKDLKYSIEERDKLFVSNMWRVIYGLLAIVGAIALIVAGVETKIWDFFASAGGVVNGVGATLAVALVVGLKVYEKKVRRDSD